MKKAVILLSGGLDSATVLALAIRDGYECHSLGFAYGQRHNHEVEKARLIAAKYGIHHKIVTIDLSTFGGSAITDDAIDVPKSSPPPSGRRLGGGLWRERTKPEILRRAKESRKNPTEPEKRIWKAIRNTQLDGYKFRRQEVMGNYIADFVCYEKNLIIEIDGESHIASKDYDRYRTEYLEKNGLKVIRFWNNEIMENLEGVLFMVSQELRNTNPPPTSSLREEAIPITYVPARNTIFLSYALAYAEVLGANNIFIGVNAVDYSGYPDCRPEYIKAFENMANLATKTGVEGNHLTIHTPLIHLSKAEIIKLGLANGVDYSMTTSCYDPIDETACGACDACNLRLKGFEQNGIKDPVKYACQ